LAGIDDNCFRSPQLGGDPDRRKGSMRNDDFAWQRRGQQRIGYKEQHEQRSADPQQITPQGNLRID